MERFNQNGSDQLQRLIDDYRFLEEDKISLEDELRECRSMNHNLLKSNEEMQERLEKVTIERDKLQAFAVNLTTRIQVFGEMAQNLITEAGRHAIAAATRQQGRRVEAERVGAPIPEDRRYRMMPLEEQARAPVRQVRPVVEDEPDPHLAELADRIGSRTMPPTNKYG